MIHFVQLVAQVNFAHRDECFKYRHKSVFFTLRYDG
jgi:hypothetical protein